MSPDPEGGRHNQTKICCVNMLISSDSRSAIASENMNISWTGQVTRVSHTCLGVWLKQMILSCQINHVLFSEKVPLLVQRSAH